MPRRTVTTEVQESDGDDQYPDHPLFPLEEGDKSIDVSYIQITRFENGVQKYGPTISASDLLTEQDIETRYGGGEYILIARAASKIDGVPGRFRRHRRIHLPGKPKPLSANPTEAEEKLAGVDAANGHAASATPAGGDTMSFMTMMLQMQQQSLERERQASERFMTMFLGMMNGSKSDSQNMMNMMMTMSSQQQQGMLQFISAMMSNRGGGPEEMAKYAELLKTLGVGSSVAKETKEESPGIGKMLEDAADLVQGMVQLKNSAMPAAPTQVDTTQVPIGGATSLLKGLVR